jgi:S-adenosylmethionine synthetase
MGRFPTFKTKNFSDISGKIIEKEVELFTWEKLDYVKQIREKFKLIK